jgi:short-subunit dehydrogenase
MATVLVLGATSGIGRAIARQLAGDGFDLVLAGRDETALNVSASDLRIRSGVRVQVRRFEALDFAGHASWLAACAAEASGTLGGLVLCHGVMEEEELAARDPERARHMIDVNFTSAVCLLDRAAELFAARAQGFLCVVTSVAGDRGRASNFHYGATKAALSTYLSGLRVRLARVGVAVIDVRPGMIDTQLTYGRGGLVLLAPPSRVARDVARAIRRRSAVVYTPRIWQLVMFAIRALPEFVFRRLPL